MTFKEFLKKIYDNASGNWWLPESFLLPETHTKRKPDGASRYDNGLTFSTTWSMGGTSGSCFSDELGIVDPQMEPEFGQLDEILELVAPNIGFLQYKGIVRDVMKRGESYHNDYYGGSTTEGWKGFNIKDLYDALVERGLI